MSRHRDIQIATVEGVMALMETHGTLNPAPDRIIPNGNGYSCWFTDADIGTRPLTAAEIVDRIEARAKATGHSPRDAA